VRRKRWLRRLARWVRLGCLPALAGLLSAGPGVASAADLPIPRTDYPPTTHFRYFPDWSNRQFDCNFGWNCDSGEPFLHTRTEDQLHRQSGWAIWGEWHGDKMGFELYSSIYAPTTTPNSTAWSDTAAQDEHGALDALNDGTEAKTIPAVLPCDTPGQTFAVWVDKAYWHVLFITVSWGGTREIEAATVYPRKRKWEARNYLITQVRAAVLQANPTAATSTQFGVNGTCP
jgi:hypothetical protein